MRSTRPLIALITGSSAMPQIGHVPGASRRISGCMGHVYCAPSWMLTGSSGVGARYAVDIDAAVTGPPWVVPWEAWQQP